LLAPAVEGRLTPLSTSVRVDGVLPGAHVQVLVDGAPYGTGEGWAATGNHAQVLLIGFQFPPAALHLFSDLLPFWRWAAS
jgi:hypothetical protein